MSPNTLLADYYADWISTYKEGGALRPSTMQSYRYAMMQLKMLAPALTLKELNRREYQQILNRFSEGRAWRSVKHLHALLKPAVLDALDDGLISTNPTRRTVIKGTQKDGVRKWLNQDEAARLCQELELETPAIRDAPRMHSRGQTLEVNWDWLILLCLKTGLRFSEALGLTPSDFDFAGQTLSIIKTFDYKYSFQLINETKSRTSARTILIDKHLCNLFEKATSGADHDAPIFIPPGQRVHNSTACKRLATLCFQADVPAISVHGLRHTHASMLLYNGVSINTVSKRLGHSSLSMTLEHYLHIIKELEERDNYKIAESMESIFIF